MPGLIRGVARTAAIAGTATAVSGRVQRRQAMRYGETQQQQSYAPEPVVPPQASGGPDTLDQLARLGELRTQGVLTEEEFAREKARILG